MRATRTARTAGVAAAAVLALGLAGCGDSDLSVPVPEAEAARDITAQLQRAADEQGVCYGWQLSGGGSTSRGSNLGPAVAVDSDPQRCPRWVEVRASVHYVPESSESEDSATVDVQTSSDLTIGPAVEANLDRFGIDEQAFVDDPAWATGRAALALPLLTAEAGGADPAPLPTASPTAEPRALPDPGSDFWRDRLGLVIAAAVLLAVAALFVLIGVLAGRRHRVPTARR